VSGDICVIDSSPLILLGKIRQLELLEKLAAKIIVPETVLEEIRNGADKDPFSHNTITWVKSYLVANIAIPVSVVAWDVGPGESQVIAHCLLGGYRAVLDDGKARACASSHSVPLIGTLGMILRAKRKGLISSARPIVERLVAAGSFMDLELVEKALADIGE